MKRRLLIRCLFITVMFCGYGLPVINAADVLKYAGSNQIYHACDQDIITAFSQATGIKVDVKLSSSWAAVYRVKTGASDVASTARKLSEMHPQLGFYQLALCKDALAVIVRDRLVESLSQNQLCDIFSGRIKTWRQIGGPDLPVIVVVPAADTAASKNFKQYVMPHRSYEYDFKSHSSTMTILAIQHLPVGAISFASSGAVMHKNNIHHLKIDNMSPVMKNYPYAQTFYHVTRNEPKGIVKQFIDFARSEKGRKVIVKKGMVPLF